MARMASVVIPGIPHHIPQRGVRRMETFFDDEDYEAYLWMGSLPVLRRLRWTITRSSYGTNTTALLLRFSNQNTAKLLVKS